MKKAVYHEVKSSSFAVEPGKAGRADVLGCAQPTGSRRASALLTRAWWAGESAALAVGSLRASGPQLRPPLCSLPSLLALEKTGQLHSSVFTSSFSATCRHVRPGWDLWSGEGERPPPQNSTPECINRGAGTNRGPGFSSVWASGAQQGARPQGRVLELRPKGWVETGAPWRSSGSGHFQGSGHRFDPCLGN